VVNPNNGPGDGLVPNDDYSEAVSQLSSYSNVQLLGYVRTGYAARNITDVIKEVSVYSGWSSNSSSLAMHGIFLDEAPHQYTAEAVDFIRKVDQVVKDSTGLRSARTVRLVPYVLSSPLR
jgi:Spherulation-specific family 4